MLADFSASRIHRNSDMNYGIFNVRLQSLICNTTQAAAFRLQDFGLAAPTSFV